MGVSVFWPLSVQCVFVCVCVCVCVSVCVGYQIREPYYVTDLSKRDTLVHKTHIGPSGTKLPRLPMCRSIISLSKIIHQMWRDHPFSQISKTTEIAVGVGVGRDREGGRGWTKFEKRGR